VFTVEAVFMGCRHFNGNFGETFESRLVIDSFVVPKCVYQAMIVIDNPVVTGNIHEPEMMTEFAIWGQAKSYHIYSNNNYQKYPLESFQADHFGL